MMLDPCRDLRGALGAAALAGGDPADDIALRAHLDGCPACRAELRELTLVARALATVPASALDAAPAEPSGALGARVLERLARERAEVHSRRVRRTFVGAGSLATVAAAVIALVLVIGNGGGTGPAGTRVVLPAVGGERATATATLRAKDAGTEVEMHVTGLHRGDYYWLWVTDGGGHRLPAGTFQGSDHPLTMRLTAAMPLSEARRIWVTDGDDKVVLDAPVPFST
jgi:anti-sigma factor RsiW